MKKIKNLLIASIVILLVSCAVTKNGNTKTLKLTSSVYNSYTLGVKMNNGKTSGTSYSMFFDNKEDVKVEKVWINGTNIDFEQVKTSPNSFRLRSTFYNGTKSNIHNNIKAPFEYSGKALVQYLENSEVKFYVVKDFKKLESYTLAK